MTTTTVAKMMLLLALIAFLGGCSGEDKLRGRRPAEQSERRIQACDKDAKFKLSQEPGNRRGGRGGGAIRCGVRLRRPESFRLAGIGETLAPVEPPTSKPTVSPIQIEALTAEGPGETCDSAISIAVGTSVTWSNVGVPETPMMCNASFDPSGPSAWYTFVGTGGTVFVSACEANGIYSGIYISNSPAGTCSSLACSTRSSGVGNVCANKIDSYTATFGTVAGRPYHIQVFSLGAEGTSGFLRVENA